MPFLTFLPLVSLSCVTKENINKNNADININKSQKEEAKNNKETNWNTFLKYEYIDLLLRLNFENKEERDKYIESQKKRDEAYLNEIKEALYYTNAVALSHHVTDNVVYEEFSSKLDKLFTEDWLWFLFNLDRFTFINYEVFNGFKGEFDHLNEDLQKNAQKLGAFNRPKTNQIYSYAVWNNKPDTYNDWIKEVHFITKEGIIFKADLKKDKKTKKISTTIFRYSYIYPDLFNNEKRIKDDFDLGRYVSVLKKGEGVLSKDGNKREGSAEKILFDETFGGEPLRYTIVDIDNKEASKS
ncbi:aromatic motif membrane protein [Metamycoplasma auris]|nr:aromatic motif membrane protein [Metamycoplasma auris]